MAPDRYLNLLFTEDQVVITQETENGNYMCNTLAENLNNWVLKVYYS